MNVQVALPLERQEEVADTFMEQLQSVDISSRARYLFEYVPLFQVVVAGHLAKHDVGRAMQYAELGKGTSLSQIACMSLPERRAAADVFATCGVPQRNKDASHQILAECKVASLVKKVPTLKFCHFSVQDMKALASSDTCVLSLFFTKTSLAVFSCFLHDGDQVVRLHEVDAKHTSALRTQLDNYMSVCNADSCSVLGEAASFGAGLRAALAQIASEHKMPDGLTVEAALDAIHDVLEAILSPLVQSLDDDAKLASSVLIPSTAKRIIVSPHLALTNINFSSIPCLQSRSVVFTPNLRFFAAIDARDNTSIGSLEVTSLLADPDSNLHADAELHGLQSELGSACKVSVCAPSSEALVDHLQSSSGMLHLVTHAHVEPLVPSSAFLRLIPFHEGDSNSFQLQMHCVLASQLVCPLAILAGCESAATAGGPSACDDLTIATTFLASGCRNVLASCWPIRSVSCSLLVMYFSRLLAAEVKRSKTSVDIRPSALLLQAQDWLRNLTMDECESFVAELKIQPAARSQLLSMIGDCTGLFPFCHPVHWAALQMIGCDRLVLAEKAAPRVKIPPPDLIHTYYRILFSDKCAVFTEINVNLRLASIIRQDDGLRLSEMAADGIATVI